MFKTLFKPEVFFRWYKKDGVRLVPVSARPGVILLSGSLYFQQVSVRDSGTYVCVVNNSAGEKRMESSLTVTGKLCLNNSSFSFNSFSSGIKILMSYIWTLLWDTLQTMTPFLFDTSVVLYKIHSTSISTFFFLTNYF